MSRCFSELLQRHYRAAPAAGSHTNLFFRLAPERWLESLVTRQCPRHRRAAGPAALSIRRCRLLRASDRAMLDVLTCTLERTPGGAGAEGQRRHPPAASGPGLLGARALAPAARRIQPVTATLPGGRYPARRPCSTWWLRRCESIPRRISLLRYLSPRIEWTWCEVDERWRGGSVRVVNRKCTAGRSTR